MKNNQINKVETQNLNYFCPLNMTNCEGEVITRNLFTKKQNIELSGKSRCLNIGINSVSLNGNEFSVEFSSYGQNNLSICSEFFDLNLPKGDFTILINGLKKIFGESVMDYAGVKGKVRRIENKFLN